MSPLAKIIAAMIASDGPMPLDRYMAICLGHPEHGYYMTRDPFGRAGDFVTAPEVSQIFGELLGVWCLAVWQSMGEPRHFALVELGPGRGTLMADMIRVLRKNPKAMPDVHFVETSPVLREAQRDNVPNATWHGTIASLPALPTLFVANEFFDALPIRQFERQGSKTFERCIGLNGDDLAVGLVPSAMPAPIEGEGVWEDSTIRDMLAMELGHYLCTVSGAGLIIDYGHTRSGAGDTLQAIRHHGFTTIVDNPGNADLTSHVDFEALARGFVRGGAKVAGLMTQGDFLNAMGLQQRTKILSRTLADEAKANLVSASERLAHTAQMGHLFKVAAVTGGEIPAPYPFGVS